MIVAVGGRPWTGKTTLAQALAEALRAVLLNKAELRRVFFPQARHVLAREERPAGRVPSPNHRVAPRDGPRPPWYSTAAPSPIPAK